MATESESSRCGPHENRVAQLTEGTCQGDRRDEETGGEVQRRLRGVFRDLRRQLSADEHGSPSPTFFVELGCHDI